MPAIPFKAGESALQCCRKCSCHLPQTRSLLCHIVPRSFHTSTNSQDERRPHERVLHFGRKDGSPASQPTPAGKINMRKGFRLAITTGKDQPIEPIVLKNYEEKNHGRKRQKLVTAVGKEAQLTSTAELMRSIEGVTEHSQDDVNKEIDGIKDKLLKEDKALRSRERRVAAKRAELQGETIRRPRGQLDSTIPAPNVILQATYARCQQQLGDMFDADQLLAYTQHYLAQNQQDPRFTRLRSVEDVPISGSQLHQGWRPLSKDFNRLLSHRSRSRKAVADRIIRWLWQYEVEEEVQSTGTMSVAVDNDISPFFVKSRHATVLPFLGTSPMVTIGLRPDGLSIEIRGPKFECFEMERTIRQRMADISVVRLDTHRYHVERVENAKREKRPKPVDRVLPARTVEAIVQAHNCVSPKVDGNTIKIIGPNPDATEDCERALISAIQLPFHGTYSIVTGGKEVEGALCLDQQAMESLPWIAKQESLGRFVAPRSIQSATEQPGAVDVEVEGLVDVFDHVKHLKNAFHSDTPIPDKGFLDWTLRSDVTAEVGKILHPMQDHSPLMSMTGEELATHTKQAPNFASTLQGIPQLLAVTLQKPPLRPSSHVRLTLAGRLASSTDSTGGSIPLLKVDLRREGNVATVLAARLVRETNIKDIMLPSLPLDIRFTQSNALELSNPNDNLKLVDFASNVQYTGERWTSDWILDLRIPSSAFISHKLYGSTKQRKPHVKSAKDEGNGPINIQYVPVNLERIQTISFPFRKHILDITHVNSGHFGMNAEQIRLRMATPQEQKDIFRVEQSDAAKGFLPLITSETSTSSPVTSTDIPFNDDNVGALKTADDASSASPLETGYLESVAHLVRRISRGTGNMDFIRMDLSRAPRAVR